MKYQMNIHRLTGLLLPAFCLTLAIGCSHEEPVDIPDMEPRSEIHFFTSTRTRSENNGLTTSAKVRIYPYQQKTGVTAPVMEGGKKYTANDPDGTTLAPVASAEGSEAKDMILPAGKFGFYAVSTNSSTAEAPEFNTIANEGYPTDDSKSTTALVNGIDYLHAVAEKKIQFGTGQNIPLIFKHVGTQVQLTVQFDKNACAADESAAQKFDLADVWVQQTDVTDAYMYLKDGQVRVSNNIGLQPLDCGSEVDGLKTDQMAIMSVEKVGNVNGSIPANQVATYNMLPLKAGGSLKMWIKVVIKDLKVGDTDVATHTYTGQLDASNGWNSGERNSYTLILKGNVITFSGVTVEDWKSGTSGVVGGVTDSKTN
ncbi:fimbrillin family protein [Parabacteroides gordonii]|jgi:hypothetical protein|uniref:Fimbrillin family protein n=1 Tax=Parabacteroides gordonii MS-1 = DSM 23371 TaxID=1203610 RepID=A0A0F5J8F0_9BACT|nr:fimbrillin family protein [Parabacteroides gordonii]KKB54054.1 hypothetical protein HMPREF1536_03635 [Parabacteroides gordonii MS-1 = DSM 23371]MCA5584875.1 fimbrillin family protein [Parabacteroides gordonii]RGP14157.1 hypothetical protein DXB27_18270 [Parabacteroides gordonii]